MATEWTVQIKGISSIQRILLDFTDVKLLFWLTTVMGLGPWEMFFASSQYINNITLLKNSLLKSLDSLIIQQPLCFQLLSESKENPETNSSN